LHRARHVDPQSAVHAFQEAGLGAGALRQRFHALHLRTGRVVVQVPRTPAVVRVLRPAGEVLATAVAAPEPIRRVGASGDIHGDMARRDDQRGGGDRQTIRVHRIDRTDDPRRDERLVGDERDAFPVALVIVAVQEAVVEVPGVVVVAVEDPVVPVPQPPVTRPAVVHRRAGAAVTVGRRRPCDPDRLPRVHAGPGLRRGVVRSISSVAVHLEIVAIEEDLVSGPVREVLSEEGVDVEGAPALGRVEEQVRPQARRELDLRGTAVDQLRAPGQERRRERIDRQRAGRPVGRRVVAIAPDDRERDGQEQRQLPRHVDPLSARA
jgi:hypothetical protein